MHGVKGQPRAALLPQGLGTNQGHGGFVTRFGLTGDIAHRFIQQQGDALLLLPVGEWIEANRAIGINFGAQFADALPVYPHPAALDIGIGFAARAQSTFGHQFGETYGLGHNRQLLDETGIMLELQHMPSIYSGLTQRAGLGIFMSRMPRILRPVTPDSSISCFPPIADRRARALILGSMPGKESLRARQYYAHPRNAFWMIMGDLLGAEPELAYKTRTTILKAAGIAVWDVLASCTRASSLDADIDPATLVVNDFAAFYRAHPHITQVFFNGAMAEKFYLKHVSFTAHPNVHFQRLPSTSPAHAGMPYAQKLHHWQAIMQQRDVMNDRHAGLALDK